MVDPTPEQQDAIDTYGDGLDMVIQAGAGCGKSSTLKMIAKSDACRQMTYVAYNKAIAADASRTMPGNVLSKTGHALAFDPKYLPRLNMPRQTAHAAAQALDVRKILGILGQTPAIPTDVGMPKAMTSKIIMRIALDTISRWCHSADPEIRAKHVPRYEGLTKEEPRNALLSLVLPVALAAWEDLTEEEGVLKLSHDHYLKQWALPGPKLPTDVVLLDEAQDCQPAGTVVTTPSGPVKIEDLRQGDLVISYTPGSLRLRMRGSRVSSISSRFHDGELITVETASGVKSRYTPEHICIAKVGPALDGKTLLYLMRKGNSFRIGTTSPHHGRTASGRHRVSGVAGRMRNEKADAVWILDTFADKRDALVAEAAASVRFGIPEMRFVDAGQMTIGQGRLDEFWRDLGDLTSNAEKCLAAFGRDIRYPLATSTTGPLAVTSCGDVADASWPARRSPANSRASQPIWPCSTRSFNEAGNRASYLLYSRAATVRACNLLDGMLVLDARELSSRRSQVARRAGDPAWVPISVSRELYTGDVWSMDVENDHTYIGDGIVTHNCNDVLSDVMLRQEHAQRIAVGDSSQQIYSWRGAKDALKKFTTALGCPELTLSQSFRFGPDIAEQANLWLRTIDAPLRLTGFDQCESTVGPVTDPDAVLCRTNAGAMGIVMEALGAGRKVALVCGGSEIKRLAWAAEALQSGRPTDHPELLAFPSWDAVREYADEEDGSLKVLVKLIDEHGTDRIQAAADALASEDAAELVVSTAHKSKGREWPKVRIHSDFRPPKPDQKTGHITLRREEGRLAYVAVTRARERLDNQALAWVDTINVVSD